MTIKPSKDPYINSLIYTDFTELCPTRYQMIKYSTWRAYLLTEIQSTLIDSQVKKKLIVNSSQQFPQLAYSQDRKQFYDFIFKPTEPNYDKNYKELTRNDNISHFICRMLYCQDEGSQLSFIEVQKKILDCRLRKILRQGSISDRKHLMDLMKKLLLALKDIDIVTSYDINTEQWQRTKNLITFSILNHRKNQQHEGLYAKLPFQQAQAGIRKRRSYIQQGYVYIGTQYMIDILLTNYQYYLRNKLQKTKSLVQNLLIEDIENQFSAFLITTLKQINQQNTQQEKYHSGKYNITLKNIQILMKYFPPCMLNLNQYLKINRHLRHDGRRQLWGFFKACGMDVYDNKQYFRRHLEGKVTASEMKTHMYNIEHVYGLQGKKKVENPWKCRNIITGVAPKKGQHHGCPFYHWRTEQLSQFLRKNYKISEDKLKQIIAQKQQKHFQVACGRLFECSGANQHSGMIPAQITSKLGKAPHLFYQAGMELREKKLKEVEGHSAMNPEGRGSTTDF